MQTLDASVLSHILSFITSDRDCLSLAHTSRAWRGLCHGPVFSIIRGDFSSLLDACSKGRTLLVRLAMGMGWDEWRAGMKQALHGEHASIISLLLPHVTDLRHSIKAAAFLGDEERMVREIDEGMSPSRWRKYMEYGYRGKKLDITEMFNRYYPLGCRGNANLMGELAIAAGDVKRLEKGLVRDDSCPRFYKAYRAYMRLACRYHHDHLIGRILDDISLLDTNQAYASCFSELARRGRLDFISAYWERAALSRDLMRCVCKNAHRGGDMALVAWLNSRGAYYPRDAFIGACRGGRRELAEKVLADALKLGLQVSLCYALTVAIRRNDVALMEWIIGKGVTPEKVLAHGDPLDYGIAVGSCYDAMELLIERGMVDRNRVLARSAGMDDIRMMKMAIKAGATDIDYALDTAACHTCVRSILFLLRAGAMPTKESDAVIERIRWMQRYREDYSVGR
jgi:hypothetical protein